MLKIIERPKHRKPRVSRLTVYSKEYTDDLVRQFLAKFKSDKRKFDPKLKVIGLSKGGYSYILNTGKIRGKRIIETLRAYVEDRVPKFANLPGGYSFCGGCEEVFTVTEMKDQYHCKLCQSEMNYESKIRTGYYAFYKKIRYSRMLEPGKYRDEYLSKRRNYHRRRTYGSLAKCVDLINELKKEVEFINGN